MTDIADIAETVFSSFGIDGIVSDAVGTETISETSFQNGSESTAFSLSGAYHMLHIGQKLAKNKADPAKLGASCDDPMGANESARQTGSNDTRPEHLLETACY